MRASGRSAQQSYLRATARALSCLVLAFAILTGLFQANTRYFYCASMGLSHVDPCVARAQRDELPPATDEVSQTPFTCCSTGVLGDVPSSTALEAMRVTDPRPLAVIGLPRSVEASLRVATLVPGPLPRAHRSLAPPRPAREQSMVSLT